MNKPLGSVAITRSPQVNEPVRANSRQGFDPFDRVPPLCRDGSITPDIGRSACFNVWPSQHRMLCLTFGLLTIGLAIGCVNKEKRPPGAALSLPAQTAVAPSTNHPEPNRDPRNAFETRTKSASFSNVRLAQECAPVDLTKLYRYVEGTDACMVEMSANEVDTKLNDAFATNVLRKEERPRSIDTIVSAMALSGLLQSSYLVGEGSQIPAQSVPRTANRDLRYLVNWADSANSPMLFLSGAPGGNSSFLQLIGWDNKNLVFNFYEYRPQIGTHEPKAWSWAGETTLAATSSNQNVGCFDCHHNGVPIMKELSRPWNNWQSELAQVSPSNVPEAVAAEKLFQQRSGAERLEPLIRSAYQIYYRLWLRANYQTQNGGTVRLTNTDRMLRRLTTNTTVNFAASQVQSRGHATSPPNANLSGIPDSLFLWDTMLRTSSVGLDYQIPALQFERKDYEAYLIDHAFQLVPDDRSYSVPGSTWFSFFVPVPADEDQFLLLQLLSAKVFTEKFVAAVLLVDFPNPVFSNTRTSLQQYGDQIKIGTLSGSKSSVVEDFVTLVRAGAQGQPKCTTDFLACSPEQQFLATWNLPEASWRVDSSKRVRDYLDRVVANYSLDDVMRLAQRRRDAFTQAPAIANLNEFSLLLPQNDLKED